MDLPCGIPCIIQLSLRLVSLPWSGMCGQVSQTKLRRPDKGTIVTADSWKPRRVHGGVPTLEHRKKIT